MSHDEAKLPQALCWSASQCVLPCWVCLQAGLPSAHQSPAAAHLCWTPPPPPESAAPCRAAPASRREQRASLGESSVLRSARNSSAHEPTAATGQLRRGLASTLVPLAITNYTSTSSGSSRSSTQCVCAPAASAAGKRAALLRFRRRTGSRGPAAPADQAMKGQRSPELSRRAWLCAIVLFGRQQAAVDRCRSSSPPKGLELRPTRTWRNARMRPCRPGRSSMRAPAAAVVCG